MTDPDLPNCIIVSLGDRKELSENTLAKIQSYATEEVEGLPENYIIVLSSTDPEDVEETRAELYSTGVPFDELHVIGATPEYEILKESITPRYNVMEILRDE